MESTNIEWADATLNTAWGCTKVSRGCKHCYMYRMSPGFGRNPNNPTERSMDNILKALRQIDKKGRCIIFVNSMSDTFHPDWNDDLITSWIDIFKESKHQFLILTKRIERAADYFHARPVPDNCWIGTSIEDKAALTRLRPLRQINARIRFVSAEPLLEDLGSVIWRGIHWVIVGGESGTRNPRTYRKFEEQWARNIRDQCQQQGVPFFYKQSGGHTKNGPVWGTNILDGQKYLEMPQALATKESHTTGGIGIPEKHQIPPQQRMVQTTL